MASFSYRREEKGEEEEFYSQEEMSSIKQRLRGFLTWEVAFRNLGDVEEKGQSSQEVHH